MTERSGPPGVRVVFDVDGLDALIRALSTRGYDVFGPVLRDGAVSPGRITSVTELPRGVTTEQSPGRYRIGHDGEALFGHAAATSWKSLLFPSRRVLWRFDADGVPVAPPPDPTKQALVGVRPCDLHGLQVHDRVLASRQSADADYVERRRRTFVVVVACGQPAATCFCTSMGTGPGAGPGFDIALTELLDAGGHRFVADSGTPAGVEVLASIPTRPATDRDRRAAAAVLASAAAAMQRAVDTDGIRDLLYANLDHPRWTEVASRCLGCANCTLVCPTCFCVTTADVYDLTEPVGRDQTWDSCFHVDHSQLHGGPVRGSTRPRYRQWLTHKFASWIDQFGTSGCVGCGRCITWCPAGIDVTEELAAIRATAAGEEPT